MQMNTILSDGVVAVAVDVLISSLLVQFNCYRDIRIAIEMLSSCSVRESGMATSRFLIFSSIQSGEMSAMRQSTRVLFFVKFQNREYNR